MQGRSHRMRRTDPMRLPAPVPPAAKWSYPIRVGAVDLGTNGIRCIAAEFSGPLRYRVLDAWRASVRLGHDVFRTQRIGPHASALALQALGRFRRQLQALDVRHQRWVATSAVREARNGGSFARLVRDRLGVELEIITGSEEARLVYLAVRQRLRLGRRSWWLVNVGGGSVETAVIDARGLSSSQSHTLGAVRLFEELGGTQGRDPGADYPRLLKDYVAALRLPPLPRRPPLAGLIATGGNIEVLAKLAGCRLRVGRAAVLTVAALRRVIGELALLTPRQRVRVLGLRPDRADVILPAAMVYARLAEQAGVKRLEVPFVGTKEGILVDLAERLASANRYEQHQEQQLFHAAVNLGRHYHFDEPHSLQVARLVLSLFKQLRPVHGLGAREYRWLLAAALLHDVGTYISYKRHHKHSLYLIAQSELPGFGPDEMLAVANIARYHRKNGPQADHAEYGRLAKNDQERVLKLAALLRLADALDREHSQNVRDLKVEIHQGSLRLRLLTHSDPRLAVWAVKRKAGLFTEVFGLRVRIAN